MAPDTGLVAGIDLGGTKIQTTVFDAQWSVVNSKRSSTPDSVYQELLQVLAEHIDWASNTDNTRQIPVGIGVPGIIDTRTARLRTANLCADGQTIGKDLNDLTGRSAALINDCKAFALAEACLGSATGYQSVLGISIGTGIAGGLVINKTLLPDANGMAGEFGHMAIPATTLSKYNLPVLPCGCGNHGCYETFVCGPGFERFAAHMENAGHATVSDWIERFNAGDTAAVKVTHRWFELLAEMIYQLTLCYDPDCIVFGGGISNYPDFIRLLNQAFGKLNRLTSNTPAFTLALASEHSGAKGAALFASGQHQATQQLR